MSAYNSIMLFHLPVLPIGDYDLTTNIYPSIIYVILSMICEFIKLIIRLSQSGGDAYRAKRKMAFFVFLSMKAVELKCQKLIVKKVCQVQHFKTFRKAIQRER